MHEIGRVEKGVGRVVKVKMAEPAFWLVREALRSLCQAWDEAAP